MHQGCPPYAYIVCNRQLHVNGVVLATCARPRNDVEPLEGNLSLGVLTETKLFRRFVKALECGVDLSQLARNARGVRLIKFLVERVRSQIGRMERNNRQISGFLAFAPARTLGDDAVE